MCTNAPRLENLNRSIVSDSEAAALLRHPLNTTSIIFGAVSSLFIFRFSLKFVNSTQFSIKAKRAINTNVTEADFSHGSTKV